MCACNFAAIHAIDYDSLAWVCQGAMPSCLLQYLCDYCAGADWAQSRHPALYKEQTRQAGMFVQLVCSAQRLAAYHVRMAVEDQRAVPAVS